jgi:predicted transcriptional regulator
MAFLQDRRIALLSVHPRYAAALMGGQKKVEFRRRALSAETQYVIVYATAPVQKVVGWFEIAEIASDSPDRLWERFGHEGQVAKQDFERYYERCDAGAAIRVRKVVALKSPVTLAELDDAMAAPQSYRYVSTEILAALRGRLVAAT